MKRNESNMDRIIRVVVGVVLLGVALAMQSWVVGVVGVIALATGAIGWCAIYQVLGISTNSQQTNK